MTPVGRRMVVAAGAVVSCLLGGPVSAQMVPPHDRAPASSPGFLTNFNYHLAIATLSGDDPLAQWDADLGGDFDLVDFGRGRINVLFNYEGVLGEELQPFDPAFANYTIGVLGSVRFGTIEVAGVFEHVSRHLGDRPKAFGIAWNGLGGELRDRRQWGGWDVESRVRVLAVVAASYVDYDAEATADLTVRYRFSPRLTWLARGYGRYLAVDPRQFGRTDRPGGLAEVGLRVLGERAALEVVVGAEHRLDVDPVRLGAGSWMFLGVRVINRPAVP
jgi:hypothetical protein